jgi:hypothetical protein
MDFATRSQSSILSTTRKGKKNVTWAIMKKTLYGQNKHFMDVGKKASWVEVLITVSKDPS